MKKLILLTLLLILPTVCFAQSVTPKLPGDKAGVGQPPEHMGDAIEVAKGEKLSKASGYFARARNLLIAAVREFDQGLALVDPSSMLDIGVWRGGVINRIDELGRLLDPQPRVSKGGARYEAQPKLLGTKGKK